MTAFATRLSQLMAVGFAAASAADVLFHFSAHQMASAAHAVAAQRWARKHHLKCNRVSKAVRKKPTRKNTNYVHQADVGH